MKQPTTIFKKTKIDSGIKPVVQYICFLQRPKTKDKRTDKQILRSYLRKQRRKERKRLKKSKTINWDKRRAFYENYLKSSKWQEVRKVIFERSGDHCEDCGKVCYHLHVHHKTYVRLGKEMMIDLEALCPDCHSKPEKHPWKPSSPHL